MTPQIQFEPERIEQMIAALREAGMRITPQRVAVCEALVATDSHPTAQDLFDQLSARYATLSRATVYNTLEALIDLDLAQPLVVDSDGAMRYDANLAPHAHLVCTRCHRVEDFQPHTLARQLAAVSAATGYAFRGLCTFYHGLCPECQQRLGGHARSSQ
jgi:Fur family peroxide stress response transcriptional regulator